MADKDRSHGRERENAATATLEKLAEQKSQLHALNERLQAQGKAHWEEMNDAAGFVGAIAGAYAAYLLQGAKEKNRVVGKAQAHYAEGG